MPDTPNPLQRIVDAHVSREVAEINASDEVKSAEASATASMYDKIVVKNDSSTVDLVFALEDRAAKTAKSNPLGSKAAKVTAFGHYRILAIRGIRRQGKVGEISDDEINKWIADATK